MYANTLTPECKRFDKDNNYVVTPEDITADIRQLSKQSGLSNYEYLRITDKTPIQQPEPVLKLAGEVIAVQSDIYTISGAVKSGKSGFISMAIGASLSATGTISDGISEMEVKPNPNGKAVIHMDTEQARHKQQKNVKGILERAGLDTNPDFFLSYNIRKLPLTEYAKTTAAICNAAATEFNGIHSIWIDGGADYIAGVNDEATANDAIKFFEGLAIKYDTAVFLVVHTNPGSDKERGHFGSQCLRKSGGILTIKEDITDNSSFIEPKALRYGGKGDIPLLSFKFDKTKGYHVGTGTKNEVNSDVLRREKKIKEAYEVSKQVFSGQRSYQYNEAIDQIEKITLKSINPNKSIFTVMKSQGMILQGDDKNWRINDKYNPNS